MMNKSRFSYFFIIVMVVMALGLMFLGDDDDGSTGEPQEQAAQPDGHR